MASLLVKVKAKMSIHAHQKVRGLLEGEYGSVFKGRSMDFDDLREYIPGDDIKDVDWKATARSGQMLVKRYVAIRKHNILLVVDTGRNMAAHGASGESKRDVAVMVCGVMGYIAQKHGDLVAMVAGDRDATQYIPLKGTSAHLEQILQHVHTRTSLEAAPSNLSRQLEYIARNIRRRMMLVIVSDDLQIGAEHEQLLRRLSAQHEILWMSVGDADLVSDALLAKEVYDVASTSSMPMFVRRNAQLQKEFQETTLARRQQAQKLLERLKVSSERVTGEASVVPGIFKLLEKQRYAKR